MSFSRCEERVVVNVATGRYLPGQARLHDHIHGIQGVFWQGDVPIGCPPHSERPYAFKAYALQQAAAMGFRKLLWADASIVVINRMDAIFARAAEHGAWIADNGFINAEWTADSAYADLGITHEENARIKHVVATAFAVDLDHPKGTALLNEYFRLASETNAFCGPWRNTPETPCGGPMVSGHRHDQTALSVIAWRLGIPLTDPPAYLAYAGSQTSETILVVDGIC